MLTVFSFSRVLSQGKKMPPQDLLQAIRRRPFVPFRLHVSDGTVYEIRHPELFMVAVASAVVGVRSSAQQPPQIDHYEIADLRHIVRLEPLDTQASTGDAPQAG
jgi:hypothetical protein